MLPMVELVLDDRASHEGPAMALDGSLDEANAETGFDLWASIPEDPTTDMLAASRERGRTRAFDGTSTFLTP